MPIPAWFRGSACSPPRAAGVGTPALQLVGATGRSPADHGGAQYAVALRILVAGEEGDLR